MEKTETGMLARAKAGHDKGQVYVIIHADDAYVYLADGVNRTLAHPKKKKKKHVQMIYEQYDVSKLDDVGIKRIRKAFMKKTEE